MLFQGQQLSAVLSVDASIQYVLFSARLSKRVLAEVAWRCVVSPLLLRV